MCGSGVLRPGRVIARGDGGDRERVVWTRRAWSAMDTRYGTLALPHDGSTHDGAEELQCLAGHPERRKTSTIC